VLAETSGSTDAATRAARTPKTKRRDADADLEDGVLDRR
jgi:hypothetical protein